MFFRTAFIVTLLSAGSFWTPAQSATLTTFTRYAGTCNDLNSGNSGTVTSTCSGNVGSDGSEFEARAGFGNIGATGITRGGSGIGRASTFASEVVTSNITTGTLALNYDIAGTIFENLPAQNGAATFLINVNVGGNLVFEYYRAYNTNINTGNTFLVESRDTGAAGMNTHIFDIVGGQATVNANITIDANCFRPGCEIGGDFFNSLLFVGGTIYDENGNIANGATLTSESGFDYLAEADPHMPAVPLPATAFLLIGALGLLGTKYRRKDTKNL